ISGFAISGILLAVLVIFVAIVLIVFRQHSKRVKRELRETRNEIEETHRKRFSEEFYQDVDNMYDDGGADDFGKARKSMAYESVGDDYETFANDPTGQPHPAPRYLMGGPSVTQPKHRAPQEPEDAPVTGRCSRPGLPPKAELHLRPQGMGRFNNKEKVMVKCKSDEFPQHKQELECVNGRWVGESARCGEHIDAQVVHLDVYDCQSPGNRILLLQPINASWDTPPDIPLRANSFHIQRLPNEIPASVNGSTCYKWDIRLDRKVAVGFLLIDMWYPALNESVPIPPTITPVVSRYRSCNLQNKQVHFMKSDVVVGYYYYCDLHSEADARAEQPDLSDTITLRVNTSTKHEIGLEAVFLGGVFTKSVGGGGKVVRPDCGQFTVKNIGVDIQAEAGHSYVSCNDSYVDISADRLASGKFSRISGNPKHIFKCNVNGQWEGSWPLCLPKLYCNKEEIYDLMDSSVIIEEIGNVYYMNDTQWYAINDSWVRYACYGSDHVMAGASGVAISGIVLGALALLMATTNLVRKCRYRSFRPSGQNGNEMFINYVPLPTITKVEQTAHSGAVSTHLRMSKGLKSVTAGQALNKDFMEDMERKDNAYSVLKDDRSSPAYWQAQELADLMSINIINVLPDGVKLKPELEPPSNAICSVGHYPQKLPTFHVMWDTGAKGFNIFIDCNKYGFPQHRQELNCIHGRWVGQTPRCGKLLDAKVTHLNIYNCESTNRELISLPVDNERESTLREEELPYTFFYTRLTRDAHIFYKGSTCYKWDFRFDRKVAVAFLLIFVWYDSVNYTDYTITPVVSPYRNCRLQYVYYDNKAMGYKYYCDLEMVSNKSLAVNGGLSDNITISRRYKRELCETRKRIEETQPKRLSRELYDDTIGVDDPGADIYDSVHIHETIDSDYSEMTANRDENHSYLSVRYTVADRENAYLNMKPSG
ncbi:unnamed protein product, partial [Medioppia subpectinata]